MNPSDFFGLVDGDGRDVWLHRVNELLVEGGNEVIVKFLLVRAIEDLPGQVVNVPGVIEANVSKIERDRTV